MKSNTILITGVGGMVGSHLSDFYRMSYPEVKVVGSFFKPTTDINEIDDKVELVECDVRYFQSVLDLVENFKPDKIYHLAAQSFPPVSWCRPQETCDVNITGTINVFESVKIVKSRFKDYDPTIVVACSSAQYGQSMIDSDGFVNEDSPLLPLSPYGISKVGQDLLAYQYFMSDDIKSIRARIFNTTGPKKVGDVLSDFTKRAVLISLGLEKDFTVGNVETERAITDVRDLIRALLLLSDKGNPGEAYNICGSKKYKIKDLIRVIEDCVGVQLEPVVDKKLLRPTDEKIISGDSERLIKKTGWCQSYSIEQTIKDMVFYWRKKLGGNCLADQAEKK